jgi:uncharacterized membrane protein YraQ (UPF0718 family)
MNLLNIFWNLVIESAPWLLIGYLLAGIIKQVIPSRWIQSQLAKPGLLSIVKGAVIGAPPWRSGKRVPQEAPLLPF